MRDFEHMSFSDPSTIDDPWFPMVPGRTLVYAGHAFDGGDRVSRGVVVTTTDLTKTIAGVQARVVQELDFTDGVLEERELVFLAQDDEGNVWQLGEFPEELEDGEITKAPIWIVGYHDALAGVVMPGHPVLGTTSFGEGLGPEFHWNDRARIAAMNAETCGDLACYTGVLVIREFNPGEPHAAQLKYYAQGVGGVRVGWAGSAEEEREELVLTSIDLLRVSELTALDEEVLEQDRRGYELDPDVYGQTDPIEPMAA